MNQRYREKQLVRLLEALHVNWETFNTRLAVRKFLVHKLDLADQSRCQYDGAHRPKI
eukprot:SAG11_NODE_652_length_7925_cov_3.950166_10_plen_57_part_00